MHVAKSLEILNKLIETRPVCLAIGNFDGVHTGHKALISGLIERARQCGGIAVILTFSPHPARFFGRRASFRKIDTAYLQRRHLADLGVDALLELPFTDQLAELSGEGFVRLLTNHMLIREITVGSDFKFGKDRSCGVEDLRAIAARLGFKVFVQGLVGDAHKPVSSSMIRALIAESGDMVAVKTLLGRCFCLLGEVRSGDQVGRKLGFPTANLLIEEQVIPRVGVYCGRFRVVSNDTGVTDHEWHSCVLNVGVRPTVSGSGELRVEAHAYNAGNSLDLYGETLEIEIVRRVRDEMKFAGIDELKAQIAKDIEFAKKT